MIRSRRLFVAAFVTTLFLGVAPSVQAGDAAVDLQSVRKRIESLSSEIDTVTSNRTALAGEIQATQQRMNEVLDSMASLREEVLALEGELTRKKHALRDVRTDLSAQYQALALTRTDLDVAREDAVQYAIESYMGAGLGVPTVAISAREWTDIGIGLAYMDRASESGARTVDRFESLLIDEETEKARISGKETALAGDVEGLKTTEKSLGHLQNELQRSSDALQEEYRKQRSLLDTYDSQIGEIEGELASLEKEQASIKKLIAQQARAAGAAPGTLIRPVPGVITSGFGPRVHPIYGYTRMHNGVDMNAGMGQQIVAAADGTVFFAAVKGGYGNSIMIDHGGGMVTLYAHQSKFAVHVGDRVKAGQVIGYAGSTGVSTGPHLHFEVRINGKPVNPIKYF